MTREAAKVDRDRERPLFTGVNGPLMAWRLWPTRADSVPCLSPGLLDSCPLLGHGLRASRRVRFTKPFTYAPGTPQVCLITIRHRAGAVYGNSDLEG